MMCPNCNLPEFTGIANYVESQCLCHLSDVELIKAAAWHAAQRDRLIRLARNKPVDNQVEFYASFSKYRDGQRSMLATVISYIRQIGYDGVAERVNSQFDKQS